MLFIQKKFYRLLKDLVKFDSTKLINYKLANTNHFFLKTI